MKAGLLLLAGTVLLVWVGVLLYVDRYEGWAQLLWVLASGTAGGGVVLILEHRTDKETDDR